jgi:hypothetical protein
VILGPNQTSQLTTFLQFQSCKFEKAFFTMCVFVLRIVGLIAPFSGDCWPSDFKAVSKDLTTFVFDAAKAASDR